jgi:hypothetical protein
MHILLTQRKLKPGSYDDWRKAWWPDDWPEDTTAGKAYILRNVDDPDDIIAFGMFDSDPRTMFSDPRLEELQEKRIEGMARYVDSTGADGLYEVIEEVGP